MNKTEIKYRYLLAGGGTGGHLYPAIAIAQKLQSFGTSSELLFVGTKNKIESRVVPELGYKFKSIWISGISRKFTLKNFLVPIKLFISMLQSLWINIKFKPHVAIGTGAYVSGPALWGASIMGARIFLMEQNTYPGLTNRILEKRADKIFVSFEETKKYFRDPSKVMNSGNPIRSDIKLQNREQAVKYFSLDPSKRTLVIIGGSLGAGSINRAVAENLEKLKELGIQILWQTGEIYYKEYKNFNDDKAKVLKYFDNISLTYSIANLLIARAGATTIAEVATLGIPTIFVPSPNVAENHQFKNAKLLYNAKSAELIRDDEINEKFVETVKNLIFDDEKLDELKRNVKQFAKPDAAEIITNEIRKIAS